MSFNHFYSFHSSLSSGQTSLDSHCFRRRASRPAIHSDFACRASPFFMALYFSACRLNSSKLLTINRASLIMVFIFRIQPFEYVIFMKLIFALFLSVGALLSAVDNRFSRQLLASSDTSSVSLFSLKVPYSTLRSSKSYLAAAVRWRRPIDVMPDFYSREEMAYDWHF